MVNTGFIVAIELGTSKIVGIVSRKNEQGITTIIASETLASEGCVKHGVIYNIELASGKIKRLINLLENKIGEKIGFAYVSISGKGLKAVEHSEVKLLDGNTPITLGMLDDMEQNAKLNKPEFYNNYNLYQSHYLLDEKQEDNPIGKTGLRLETKSIIVIGPPNLKNNLKKCLDEKNNIKIKSYVIGAIASGVLLLDQDDKSAGCVLIDFGAGTTTASIYKEGLLKYMVVIPFGGASITKDIRSMGFDGETAENIKIKYGYVGKMHLNGESDKPKDLNLRELNKVIQLRMDEIVLNVLARLNESGHFTDMNSGVFITGGASQLNGLSEYLADKMKLPAKFCSPKRIYINNAAELLNNPAYSHVLGMLLFSSEDCSYVEPVVIEAPKVESPASVASATEPVETNNTEESKNEPSSKVSKNKKTKNEKHDKKNGFIGSLFEKVSSFGSVLLNDEEDENE